MRTIFRLPVVFQLADEGGHVLGIGRLYHLPLAVHQRKIEPPGMQGHPGNEGLLFNIFSRLVPLFDVGQIQHLAAIQGVHHNGCLEALQVNPDLVHTAGKGHTLHQGMGLVHIQGIEKGFGGFAFGPVDTDYAYFERQNGQIDQDALEIMNPTGDGMVNFGDFPVLKLHGNMAVGFGMFRKNEHA